MSKSKPSGRVKIKSVNPVTLPALPKQWCWVTLSEVASRQPNAITDGPFGSNLKTSHYTESGPRVIRLQNIGDGDFIDEYAHISESHFEMLAKHEIVAGDVAIAALGEKLPRSCVIPPWVGPAIVKADCPRFRPNTDLVVSSYVNFALNSPDVRNRTSEIIHGVGRPRLNLAEIRGIWLPIAPSSEQRRIVAKIEELFSDLDVGVAALTRAKANLKRYRASVLKAAVEGHLTAAWRAKHPNTEPASTLLARILTERRQKWEADQLAKFAATGKPPPKNWKDKYPEPSPPDTTNLPDLPSNWHWASGYQLFSWASGDFLPASQQVSGDVPVYGGNGVNGTHSQSNVETKTLVIGRVGVHCGNVHVTDGRAWVTDNAIYSKTTPLDCQLRFLQLCLWTANLNAQSQGGAQPFVNQRALNEVAFALPPKLEQDAVVALLEERMSQVVAAEKQINNGLIRAARLRQSILKQAFEGKLVPQDPADEPAANMLSMFSIKPEAPQSRKAKRL